MTEKEQGTYIEITQAANRAGLEIRVVRHCIELELVDERLTEDDLAELRRVRRLASLGVNLPGIEIILRMRRRIERLQDELARLESHLDS